MGGGLQQSSIFTLWPAQCKGFINRGHFVKWKAAFTALRTHWWRRTFQTSLSQSNCAHPDCRCSHSDQNKYIRCMTRSLKYEGQDIQNICICSQWIVWCWSRWLRDITCGSVAARLLELRVRVPPGAWVYLSSGCCVLSCIIICDGPIPRPEESYRVCAIGCDQVQQI